MRSSKPACWLCEFYHGIRDDLGECRRKPPVESWVSNAIKSELHQGWPQVRGEDWCGEFKKFFDGNIEPPNEIRRRPLPSEPFIKG